MGSPGSGIRFLLVSLASEERLNARLPREGQAEDGYDSTEAHILAMAGFRKPISTRRTLLKRGSGFRWSKSLSVSSSLVPRGPRASSNSLTLSHASGSRWQLKFKIFLLL